MVGIASGKLGYAGHMRGRSKKSTHDGKSNHVSYDTYKIAKGFESSSQCQDKVCTNHFYLEL